MQWQEKIHASIGRDRKKVALGYYVLDKIKFPVRYTARNPKEIRFIPLDADREMNGLQILQQHPTGRAYAWQLEGIEKFPVYYDADKKVLSMPPIINSDYSGHITPGVSDILVECSGTNQETLKKVISLAVCDLIDAGGEAYQVEIIYGDKKEKITLESEKIKLSRINTNKLLGLELKENEIKACLEKMGYNYDIKTETAQVPCWRLDVMHEVDLIEDIAIAYGYNNLIPEIPKVSTIGEESQIEKVKSKIAEILIGLDMNEISTYHMIREEDAKIFNLNKEETIGLKDSKTEYKILRPNLLVQSLITLANNTNSEYPQRLFEIGTSFSLDKENKSETGIKEQEKLCIAIANNNSNFTEVKQILDYLTRMLNKEYVIEQISAEKTHFIEGRLGEIRVNNKPIGILGEIHPQTLANLGIKMPIAALEIDIEQLIN
jgi:phenylalanyl-tRNA synthetase beta chain